MNGCKNKSDWAFFVMISLVLITMQAMADDADVSKQEALQKEIEHSLVAPCCWNMTVDQHDSPKSHEVKIKISELLKQGKSKQEILDYFVAQPQYGERILAAPSRKSLLGKMAYWLIAMAMVFGAVVVGYTIKRLSQSKAPQPDKSTPSPAQQASAEKWDKIIENELKSFE